MADLEALISAVKQAPPADCVPLVVQFNQKHDKARIIPGMTVIQKESLWRAIFLRLDDPQTNAVIISDLLNTLKILSREKEVLENVMTEEMVTCLLRRSGFELGADSEGPVGLENLNGMKVIFNVLFQSESLQCVFISKGLLKCLVDLFQSGKIQKVPLENTLFLLKIFFIITALQKKSGPIIRNELDGLAIMLDYIDLVTSSDKSYDDVTAEVVSELLKLLYNLIYDINPKPGAGEGDELELSSKDFTLLCTVTSIVRRCLLHQVQCQEKRLSIHAHSVHLLCAVPPSTFDELIEKDESEKHSRIVFESKDLSAVEAIVILLDLKLSGSDKSPAEPILVALCQMVSANRIIRKYLKRRILPPLTAQDLKQRPEVGSTLRNKLCRVIHTSTGPSAKTAATLIFILCKENVGRMIKYTGYGNAAGLLADQGLLLGGKGKGGVYSGDSESDTEEYEELMDKINSVEGWMKPEEPSLELTEEQKEYEAMKLVQQIHALTMNKAIQPCRIGPDGKPQPIEHVLELQEGLDHVIKHATSKGMSDSDSD